MQLKKLFINTMLAFTGAALLASSASAANPSYNNMDALFGFRVTSGTGSTLDGMIDLGPVSQFNHTFTLSLGNIGSFMTSNFGSDWYTRIDPGTGNTSVEWGVVAGNILTNDLWSTRITNVGWPRNFNQGVGSSAIDSAGSNYTGYTIASGTNNAVTQTASDTNSWAFFQPSPPNGAGSGGISFQTWNPNNEGQTNSTLFFDSIPTATASGQTGTVLGTFNWNSDGTLQFTAGQAVPEPSTWSLFGLGFVGSAGLTVLRRRRA